MSLLYLPSVASYIDPSNAEVYAATQDGGYDTDSSRPLLEMSETWYQGLTKPDRKIVDILLSVADQGLLAQPDKLAFLDTTANT